jgi:hypothetical protein
VLVALAAADTPIEDIEAVVEQADFRVNEEGGYKTVYKTSNNIKAEEEGDGQKVVEGSYSYVDPDGKTHTVTYIAGAGIGFKPLSDDIHPDINKAIELNLKNPPQEPKEQ